jgi:hypothetical protein
VGAALLADSFTRVWERGEHSIGLGVDAASDSGAFRLYERAGMTPALGWVMYEKQVGPDPASGPTKTFTRAEVLGIGRIGVVVLPGELADRAAL